MRPILHLLLMILILLLIPTAGFAAQKDQEHEQEGEVVGKRRSLVTLRA
jgi:putative cell wall-binding protein